MKVSTKGRYGLRALIDLGIHAVDQPEKLAHIARRQGISEGYLEQIFIKLKKEQLVKSIQGVNGGYQLACNPHRISIKEILTKIEGELQVVKVQTNETLYARCVREVVWQPLEDEILVFTASIHLQQLIDDYKALDENCGGLFEKLLEDNLFDGG